MLRNCTKLVALALTSCATIDVSPERQQTLPEIRYLSLDHDFAFVFSNPTARSGGIEAYASPNSTTQYPSFPMGEFRTADNVQCVSVGPAGNTIEFAVRRPIRAGDRYSCLSSNFEVTHCTEACRSAVIRVERSRAPDVGPLRSQMYVDRCRGVLLWS